MKSKTGFLYYLYIGLKWRKTLVLYSFIICLLTVGISFIIPKWFNSKAVILPPADDSNAIGFSSIMKNLPFGNIGLGSMSDESMLAMAIVNSRTMMESVINEFGLIKRYKAKNIEKAIKIKLKSSGIRHHNIYSSQLCTSCNKELFFSYRRDSGKTGRHWTIATIIGK